MNIVDLQMQESGWELCARINVATPLPGYVVKESATTWGVWTQLPPFTGLPVRVVGPFPILAGERFPYGIDVLPD